MESFYSPSMWFCIKKLYENVFVFTENWVKLLLDLYSYHWLLQSPLTLYWVEFLDHFYTISPPTLGLPVPQQTLLCLLYQPDMQDQEFLQKLVERKSKTMSICAYIICELK